MRASFTRMGRLTVHMYRYILRDGTHLVLSGLVASSRPVSFSVAQWEAAIPSFGFCIASRLCVARSADESLRPHRVLSPLEHIVLFYVICNFDSYTHTGNLLHSH